MSDTASLFASIEEWLCKPFDELPTEAHQAIPLVLQGSSWDEMDIAQRRAATMPWAMRNDPAMKAEQEHLRALYGKRYELEIELKEFEVAPAVLPSEIKARNGEIERLKCEIASIDAQIEKPYAPATEEPIAAGQGQPAAEEYYDGRHEIEPILGHVWVTCKKYMEAEGVKPPLRGEKWKLPKEIAKAITKKHPPKKKK